MEDIMPVHRSRKEFTIHVVLVLSVICNALIPTAAYAKSSESRDSGSPELNQDFFQSNNSGSEGVKIDQYTNFSRPVQRINETSSAILLTDGQNLSFNDNEESIDAELGNETSTSTATIDPFNLTFIDWNLDIWTGDPYQPCSGGPYVTCSATVIATQTTPNRWDFDITYNYNDNHDIIGSTFNIDLRFATGVFNTNVPVYWEMYPIVNEVMPLRSIDVQYPVEDLPAMSSPTGSWVIPPQPSPYQNFTVRFARQTTGPETLVRTDQWHFTIATYDFKESSVPDVSSITSCTSCFSDISATQGIVLGPINTRTGGYDYSYTDISIPTSAGQLSFKREYATLSIEQPTLLSPGWTHNLDTRLIFPGDPGGAPGQILFKANSANKYIFTNNGDGTYSPYPGLFASLEEGQNGYILKSSDQRTYTFDVAGRLLTYSSPEGHEWNYIYFNNDIIRVEAEGGARFLSLNYDAQGRIDEVTDHTGRSVSYYYNSNGDLSSVNDVLNQTWTYEYHPTLDHYLTRIVAPGNVTVEQTEFLPDGRAKRQFDGEGNLMGELYYNPDGSISLVDSDANTTTHIYDDRGTLVEIEGPEGGSVVKEYNANFRPVTITDEAGSTTMLTWSADGSNLIQVSDVQGNQTNITYDSLNNPVSVVDPLGYQTTFSYDGLFLESTTDALNQTTAYTYTPQGYLASVMDPLGNITSYTYDSYGQRTSMTDPLGNTWTYTYDDLGRLIDTTDPMGHITHRVYDWCMI